jgi:aminopeptidase YwaD
MARPGLALAAALAAFAALAAAPAATAGFSGDRAKYWTRQIASVGARPAGGLNERQAARIAARRFQTLGYDVRIQKFTLPGGGTSRNVIARTPGKLRVIVVAHIDGVHGTRAANDNASGVGTLLELARNLRGEEGVRLAALGAEERMVTGSPYHLGSLRFTRSLRESVKEGVRLALSVDMVGVGTTFHVRGLEESPNRSARILLRRARALGVPVSYLRDTGQSDHDDLTRGGVPAAWVEWRWDQCWHRPCDRVRRVSPRKLRRAGRVVLAATRHVLDRF